MNVRLPSMSVRMKEKDFGIEGVSECSLMPDGKQKGAIAGILKPALG